jgi:hypothetical protein
MVYEEHVGARVCCVDKVGRGTIRIEREVEIGM